VINVSWDDAQGYCDWLSRQAGRDYQLPTEAEWEYACRATTTSAFHFGQLITPDQSNFYGSATHNRSAKGEVRTKTVEVGSFPPNAFGLYDMHGNVWEWCQDSWRPSYEEAPGDATPWKSELSRFRTRRGGSHLNDPEDCRSAHRSLSAPDIREDNLGFRVCCGAPVETLDAGALES
jgi:formylglycine-generating enzyme required for sulfatase activity